MKVEVVRIGNSRGIRIPKPILEQCGLQGTVELRIENDRLVITPGHPPREGWKKRSVPPGHPPTMNCCSTPCLRTNSTKRTGGGKQAAALG
jgi:virulence-associated protein VagC